MSLSSSSTLADARAQYLDSMGYAATASVSLCNAFIEACQAMLVLEPRSGGQGAANVVTTVDIVRQELDEARAWRSAYDADANAGVVHFDCSDYRA